MTAKDNSVSLVLGSGGARGLAHIGVIEWLVEHGYEIKTISGSSMGALIGGIYATGQLDTYKEWVTALDKSDVIKLLDLSFRWGGMFRGERLMDKLQELIGNWQIEDLDIDYTAVATDVEKSAEVWLSKGSLFDAIRASIAVPLVFTPHEIHSRKLLDGGLINPLPIAPTLRSHNALTIAVNVDASPDETGVVCLKDLQELNQSSVSKTDNKHKEGIQQFIQSLQDKLQNNKEESWSFFDVMSLSIDTMQNTIVKMRNAAHSPDHMLLISSKAARAYEFYRASELIELGRFAAEKNLSETLK